MSNHLILYTSTNQKNRNDSLGAFTPEAKRLAKYIKSQGDVATIEPIATRDLSMAMRRTQVETALNSDQLDYEHIYALCHGYKHGIQFGYKWESGAERLVEQILNNNPNVKSVNFYCCSVAKDTDNFCEWVDYYLSANNSFAKEVQVFGHYTAGHTTMNPNIKIYTEYTDYVWSQKPIDGFEQLITGDKKEANKRMHDVNDSFRFEIPFLRNGTNDTKENKCKKIYLCCGDQLKCTYNVDNEIFCPHMKTESNIDQCTHYLASLYAEQGLK